MAIKWAEDGFYHVMESMVCFLAKFMAMSVVNCVSRALMVHSPPASPLCMPCMSYQKAGSGQSIGFFHDAEDMVSFAAELSASMEQAPCQHLA